MNKNETAHNAPENVKGVAKRGSIDSRSPKVMFLASVIDMSWRLAIVVLVPVIGGFELDRRFNSSPWLTIVGFLVAMCGMYIVTKQTLVKATSSPDKKGHK